MRHLRAGFLLCALALAAAAVVAIVKHAYGDGVVLFMTAGLVLGFRWYAQE